MLERDSKRAAQARDLKSSLSAEKKKGTYTSHPQHSLISRGASERLCVVAAADLKAIEGSRKTDRRNLDRERSRLSEQKAALAYEKEATAAAEIHAMDSIRSMDYRRSVAQG